MHFTHSGGNKELRNSRLLCQGRTAISYVLDSELQRLIRQRLQSGLIPHIPFKGVCWPASGKIQAAQYGQRLAYIRNVKIEGKYEVRADEKGRIHYILKNGMDLEELDGICLYTGEKQNPDYKIIAVKPYRFLTLEVEKI